MGKIPVFLTTKKLRPKTDEWARGNTSHFDDEKSSPKTGSVQAVNRHLDLTRIWENPSNGRSNRVPPQSVKATPDPRHGQAFRAVFQTQVSQRFQALF